jgi:hypothetical protein
MPGTTERASTLRILHRARKRILIEPVSRDVNLSLVVNI